jgi:hypothetical protein
MNDQIEQLKRHYRDLRAPQDLARQVQRRLADQPAQGHVRWPAVAAGAAALIVAVILWIRPADVPQQLAVNQTMAKPSLSALASMSLTRPAVAAPSLSSLRSVKVPRLPDKPRQVDLPKKSRNDTDFMKEKNHALT